MAYTNDNDDVISSINVTPLVDVALVLLIIFIITASAILRSSVPVTLPKAQTAEEATSGLLNIGITARGQIYINGRPGKLGDLPDAIAAAKKRLGKRADQVSAFVSADVKAQYGLFARVVDQLRLQGVVNIALDTQPTDETQTEVKKEARTNP